jgi:serine/threonine-protein kinase
MSFAPGIKLGPYEILSPIGAGGMGEVYKARDTRLDRTVAIKVLPEHLADTSELRERFDREARTISSLNHPNICVLHDIGRQGTTDFLVMEYLEGETLAQRLSKGPLPLGETLRVAIEIAGALDNAHRQGVTHRDLKPGNIMLTKSGAKLLDFGLAKLKSLSDPVRPVSLMQTAGAAADLTAQGTILGTLQYMAPEQVEGHEADARSDIFALGTVIFEMITGKKTFEGRSQASLMAAILDREPPAVSSLQPATPLQLDHVIRRCLAKNPDDRWQSASDLRLELKWIVDSPPSDRIIPAAAPAPRSRAFPWSKAAIVSLVFLILGAGAGWFLRPAGKAGAPVIRLSIVLPSVEELVAQGGPPIAFSPDGSQIVYVANRRLNLRPLDSLTAKPISGTENALEPFFSPDGRYIGFFAQGKLKTVSVTGDTPQVLCDAPYGVGGSWGTDGMIYFAGYNIGGLSKIPASGGAVQEVTKLNRDNGEVSHRWPQILPGAKAILFTVWTGPGWDERSLEVLSLDTGVRRKIGQGAESGRYVSPGYMIYSRAGALAALPFDLRTLAVGSTPISLGAQADELGEGPAFGVSDSAIAYIPDGGRFERRYAWVDRQGNTEILPAPPHAYENARISPDGRFAALQIVGPTYTIWVYDFERATLSPLTSAGSGSSQAPAWTPDGKYITYRGTRHGFRNIYWKSADGSGEEERLTNSESIQTPVSWSPDGKWLTFNENAASGINLWILPRDDRSKPILFQKNATGGQFSPDGNWIAYTSLESGRNEVYVRPFQSQGAKTQISNQGGSEPVWSRDGRELFYLNDLKTMVVDVRTQPSFTAGSPRALFTGHFEPSQNGVSGYDISRDGKRFLKVLSPRTEAVSQFNIVLNWLEELKR